MSELNKTTRVDFLLLIIIFLCLIKADPARADLFDSSGADKCKNDKLACELQVKYCRKKNETLKEKAESLDECRQEKSDIEKKLGRLTDESEKFNSKIERLKQSYEKEKNIAENNIRELDQAINILRQESNVQEKDLLEENRQASKQHKAELAKVANKLKAERNNHMLEIGALRKDYEAKISSANKKIYQKTATIKSKNKELAFLKKKIQKLSAPPPEFKLLADQEKKLAKTLRKEIKAKQITLIKSKDKLVINIHSRFSFASGSARLKKEIFPALDKISRVLAVYPKNKTTVRGHTDGDKLTSRIYRDNWELSAKRALAVLRRLLKNAALDKSKFSAVGHGEHNPLLPNDSSGNKAVNRRVEIEVAPF